VSRLKFCLNVLSLSRNCLERGICRRLRRPIMRGVRPFLSQKEQTMRPHAFFTRLSVVTALVLASFVGAGWKWDHIVLH